MHYSSSLIIIVYHFLIYLYHVNAGARFDITNNCPYTVWAAAIPGGGRRLNQGMTWQLDVPSSVPGSRIWGRTNCQFDSWGKGSCQTGDCEGLLQCKGFGKAPVTLAEFFLGDSELGLDFYDVSLVDGFNLPMEFRPTSGIGCQGVKCSTDITRQCPNVLRAPGGCNNPCAVFKTDQYCCPQGPSGCGPTDYSRFFKDRCPNAYSYALDDNITTFSCLTATNYTLVFCPS